jgi:hypothetical protein
MEKKGEVAGGRERVHAVTARRRIGAAAISYNAYP